jgi:hypothetical protein
MKKSRGKEKNKKTVELLDDARMGGGLPGRNTRKQSEIEQARIESRREVDPEDKAPAGDAGVEDNKEGHPTKDPIEESNY